MTERVPPNPGVPSRHGAPRPSSVANKPGESRGEPADGAKRAGDKPERTYLLLCLLCEPPLPMPFGSAEERGKWAAAHRDGAGHDRWCTWDEPQTLHPKDAPSIARLGSRTFPDLPACRHCGAPVRETNYAMGPRLEHYHPDASFRDNVWTHCRLTTAET